jgi:hypothetical protein
MTGYATRVRDTARGWAVRRLLGTVALAGALIVHGEQGWAKHHKQQLPSGIPTDPCAALNTYVQKDIGQMKSLKKAVEAENSAPDTLVGFIKHLEGQTVVDKEKVQKIAELHRQAIDVNILLHAQNCKTVDIDQALAKP